MASNLLHSRLFADADDEERRKRQAHIISGSRARLQPGPRREFIADGSLGDLRSGAMVAETAFNEGDEGEFHLRLRIIPPGTVGAIKVAVQAGGVRLTGPLRTLPGRVVVIPFRQHSPGVFVIAGAVLAVAAALIVGWAIYKITRAIGQAVGRPLGGFVKGLEKGASSLARGAETAGKGLAGAVPFILLGGVLLLAVTARKRAAPE